jgi:glyoxylase-like metal-dependent hydrolase (beta-lactamase superfamily II)
MNTDRRGLFAGSAAVAAALALPAAAQQAAAPPALAQASGFYRFKLGGFTVTTVHDGFFRRPVEGFVRGVPTAEVQALLAEAFLPGDQLTIPFTITFVETPRGLYVFDSGTGAQMAPTAGQMAANMRAAGLDPARVAGVIVSHFHGDHITGLTTAQNERAFPNAEIIVPAAEWAWWTDEANSARSPEGQRPTFANTARRFGPYQGRIRQVRDGEEVTPGIRAVSAHGHTPGHTLYHVADGADQMMFLADLTNRPEIGARRPDWQIVFDFDGDMAAATRRRVFDRVASERMRVTGYHYMFPSTGYIAREGQGFRFVPSDWSSQV